MPDYLSLRMEIGDDEDLQRTVQEPVETKIVEEAAPDIHYMLIPVDDKFEKVPLPVGVKGEEFRTVLGVAYQVWLRDGVVTARTVANLIGDDLQRIKTILASPQYKAAAKIRGIGVGAKEGLTPMQDLALQALSDITIKGGLAARLKVAGVSMGLFRAWRKQPVFEGYYKELTHGALKDNEGAMLVSLAEAGASGDLQAIKFAFEVTGKHNPAQQQAIDARAMLTQVLQILQEEIKDTAMLSKIGVRLLSVASQLGPTNTGMIERGGNDGDQNTQIRA